MDAASKMLPGLAKKEIMLNLPMLKWLGVSILVMLLDFYSKSLATESLQLYQSVAIIENWFNLTLAHNYGAAFSFLADQSGWQRWFFALTTIAISVFLLLWLIKLKPTEKLNAIAIALIIGGALGNLWDRLSLGYVIDFIDVYIIYNDMEYHWPVFNLADSFIFIGASIILLEGLIRPQNQSTEQDLASK